MAKDVVVEYVHVSYFAGKSRTASIEFAVDDDAQSESPAVVDEEHVLLSAHHSLHIFSVSEGTGVVLYAYVDVYLFRESVGERTFEEIV